MNTNRKNTTILFLISIVFILGLAAAACNLPAGLQERFFGSAGTLVPTPAPTNTPQPLPPAIVETDPLLGSGIPVLGPITIYFNQEMDQASVESALAGKPSLEGSFSWTDASILVYQPRNPLPPDTKLTISLGTSAKASNGLSLPEPLEMVFYTPTWLEPASRVPLPDSIEVDPASAVVVTFNQPVIELGEQEGDTPPAFTLSPAAPGSGEWINTSSYVFTPQGGLEGGISYQIDINPDLVSTAGTPLGLDAQESWTFTTSYPQILSWEPFSGEAGVPLDKVLTMTFNQAMDPDSLAENFRLVDGNGEEVRGEMEWSNDFQQVTFTPDENFQRSTSYAAVLPGEVVSAGNTPLMTDTTWEFISTGEFAFLGTPGGQAYTPTVYEGATLYFNNPIDLNTVEENITLIPEVENLNPSINTSDNVLNLYGDYDPLTSYTLILRESLADKWGSQLGSVRSLNFTTQPLPSNLIISQGSSFLFMTGDENAIPAQGTNLYQVSINIGTIPQQDYPLFFGTGLYNNLDDYYPADVQYWNHIVNLPGDNSYTVNLPVNQTGASLLPGLYRYQIYSQELPYNPSPYLLAVSNVHLTMKVSPENMLIWAIDLRSGLPVAGSKITVYDQVGKTIFEGTTNQDGIFQADFAEPQNLYETIYYAVTGQPGGDGFGIAASNWGFGTEPYFFGLSSDFSAPQPQTYIYTDRPIYRPGQTVYFRLIQRDKVDGKYVLPQQKTITVTFYKEGGESEDAVLPLSAYGTAHGEFQLSEFDQPGYYRLDTTDGMVFFQVAEYRKPEIDLQVSLKEAESKIGQDWQGTVDAQYYFNAPASEVNLSWALRAEPTSFYLPGYQVGVLDSDWFAYDESSLSLTWRGLVDSGEAVTDAGGKWETEGQLDKVDSYDREIKLPANYTLSVTAEDETGFQVSGQAQVLVHPADFYIGVKPSAWLAVEDQAVDFDILTVDWEKEPDGIHHLKAEFNRVTWNYEVGDYGQMEYTREAELIAEKNFSTNGDGEATLSFTPPAPGTYQLDVFGGGARTEVYLWVGGVGTAAWPTQTNQKLKLVADKDLYLPGDEAEVFIPNPFPQGAQALITIERHKVIDYQTLTISSAGEFIKIPLGDDEAPNVYVSAILLGEDSTGRADFRQGYINLLVQPVSQVLQVELVGKPDKLGPGEEVEFTIKVTDKNGKPQQGEFSLAVVDKAVLALADPNSQEIDQAFYGIQPLAVRLGFPLGVHAGRMVFIAGGLGGGGGDVAPSVREQFEDTGYWQADVVTDAAGLAVVSFTLPDNLTTWQADARGVTTQTRVGEATTEIVTTKDLLVRPVTPRFLVAGDHLALAAVVHNNTTEDLSAEVTIQCSGIQLDLPEFSTQTVDIRAGSRTRVEWWGTVEEVEEAELLFLAEADGLQDAVKPYLGPLPVLRYTAPETFGTAGFLDSAGQRMEIISLPRTFQPDEGALDLELSPSLAPVLLTALEALEEDPWYSTIEGISHFLPHVITYATLKDLDLDYPQLETNLNLVIPKTLGYLASTQNDDGGWGWWSGGSSDVEITSYILFGLIQAQKAGVFVDDLMIQQARGFLLATLPDVDMLTESWQYEQLAFRYFALTEGGTDAGTGLADLFDYSSQLSPAYQALLAVALENQTPGGELSRSLFSNLAGNGIRSSTGIHWENPEDCRCWLNNTTTTTAMVSYALARSGEFSSLMPEAVRYLLSAATPAGDWGSSYETGWSILALNEIIKARGELNVAYQYSAAVNGTELISGETEGPGGLESTVSSLPISSLYPDDPNALTISRTEGNGTLYYNTHLTVFRPAADIQPYGKGLGLSRVYTDVNESGKAKFTQSGKVGDLIQVMLTLVVENDLHYVMVEDILPAGVEVLDTRLNTSRQDVPDFQASAPFRNGWGWWYFNRPMVFDDRIVWGADYLPAGSYQLVYTISLTTPGEYQVLPARARGQYFPEIQAISAGEKFVVEAE